MTTKEIACDVYARCFGDVFGLSDVLHVLEICAEEAAAEATKALERKHEKLLAFALERTECCDVCPAVVCENESGTCPYAADLKENEERVTREWLERFIEEEQEQ